MVDVIELLISLVAWINQVIEFLKKWFGPFIE